MNSRIIFLVVSMLFAAGIVSAVNCWQYDDSQSDCEAAEDCQWEQDDWGGWCQEKGCWQLWDQTDCTNSTDDLNCLWRSSTSSSGWCEQTSCYSWEGTNAATCVNNSANKNCQWQNQCFGYNQNVNCPSLGIDECSNVTGCTWGMCEEVGCWKYDYTDQDTCQAQTGSMGNSCRWDNNGEYCYELGCWDYDNTNYTACVNNANGLACQWNAAYQRCEEIQCWKFDYTNSSVCTTDALNNYNLTCTWDGQYCMNSQCSNLNTQSNCDTTQGCSWKTQTGGGWCEEAQCWIFDQWNGGTEQQCNGTNIEPGNDAYSFNLSCEWDNGACYPNVDENCSTFTTESGCMDTYYCWWQCSDWDNQSTCTCNDPKDLGETYDDNFFQKWNPGCYIFDINYDLCNATYAGTNASYCENDTSLNIPYDCSWQNGTGQEECLAVSACHDVIGCQFSAQLGTGLCDPEPGHAFQSHIENEGLNCTMINNTQLCNNIPALSTCCEWKEGTCKEKLGKECWENMDKKMEDDFDGIKSCADASIFANPEKKCNEMGGYPLFMPCKWNSSISKCEFKSTQIFGDASQTLSLIENQKNCEAAGGKWVQEWYCEGNRSVPAGRCEQKADEENNCDVACFACEFKFDGTNFTNITNAKATCYGSDLGYCEFTADSTAKNGLGTCRAKEEFKAGIASDCTSDCGSCTYMGNPNAASNFDGNKQYSNCNSPSCYCGQAYEFGDVKCKWVNDNTSNQGGYCVDSTTKTCQDSCDRCYSKSDCNNDGRMAFNAIGSCEWVTESGEISTSATEGICRKKGSGEICWDGIDNDADDLIDCADNNCYSDSFCGFVSGDCPSITTAAVCNATQLDNGLNCTWKSDAWGSFCDFPGSDCYERDGTNQTYCEAASGCQWGSDSMGGSGWCEQDWDSANDCWSMITEATCTGGCVWTNDTWCTQNPTDQWCQDFGGWCDPAAFAPKNCWNRDDTNQSWCENLTGCFYTNSTGMCMEQGCWNYDSNVTACNQQDNCQWKQDDWQQCEVDWSVNCWLYDDNETQCDTAPECTWFDQGSNWAYCGNKFDVCWNYGSDSSSCDSDSNCYWTDWNSCEAICRDENTYGTESSCNAVDGCHWKSGWCEDTSMGGSSSGVDCGSKDESTCIAATECKWKNPGWCDPIGFSGGSAANSAGSGNNVGSECWKYDGEEALCTDASTINISCSWMDEPWPHCEPDWGSSNCWDRNETTCNESCWWSEEGWCTNANEQCKMNSSLSENSTLCDANSACNWATFNEGCREDWNSLDSCYQIWDQDDCTNATNNQTCKWETYYDQFDGQERTGCRPKFEACRDFSLSSSECNALDGCFWNEFMGMCDAVCFNMSLTEQQCGAIAGCTFGGGSCEPSLFTKQTAGECTGAGGKWLNGWCNPPGQGKMFAGMDMGPPVPIVTENCNSNGEVAYADICGVGIKDTGNSFIFGSQTADFSNVGVCNGQNVITFGSSNFGMGSANQGQGTSPVKYYVYLDTDGSTTGGCSPVNNKSMKGYEFFLKLESTYNSTLEKSTETFTAKRCSLSGSTWKIADISLSTWKQQMCSMAGGPLIAVTKTDLEKFPELYDSEKDVRVYVAMADSSRNATVPYDEAGPGWYTPGAVDFSLESLFGMGSDTAKNEDIMKKGYVEHEDCYLTGDEDKDGNADCDDWDCQYASGCESSGVNADNYTDTSMPKITGIKIEEYTDSALIMYSTNKPTNGTLAFYHNDSTCATTNATIYDKGVTTTSMRNHKLWHDGHIYNDGGVSSLDYALNSSTDYYYKLKVCDSGGKCSVSKCSSFKTAGTRCAYCNFVTLINSPSGWTVWYDLNANGIYEHEQGNVCGPKAGMKTNYTEGRKANIKMTEDDSVVVMEFLNVTLTKTGLTSKTRKISESGSLIHDTTEDYVGMPSATRDKIINNLHPELCRITIPTTGGDCSKLYHCDDNGDNCVDRTSEEGADLVSSTSTSCTWTIPYCEFSTWDADGNPSGGTTTTTSSSGGGSGGGGGAGVSVSTEKFEHGKIYLKGEEGKKVRYMLYGNSHTVTIQGIRAEEVDVLVKSVLIQDTIKLGETKYYDVTEDGKSDIGIRVHSIALNASYAELIISLLSYEPEPQPEEQPEPQPQQPIEEEPPVTGHVAEEPEEGEEEPQGGTWLVISLIAAIVVIAAVAVIAVKRKSIQAQQHHEKQPSQEKQH
ncbi:hypothetical protein GF323_03740 [Candidatus Woesearchaeota archaeon]|nr:hypothetical protein [Candidatus Woesearchaeota archaeon]